MDLASLIVAGITLMLFAVALFLKGLTHDVLLETGVFLVSVKLMMLAHKSEKASRRIEAKIDDLVENREESN
jgi:hypothetical protein